MRCQLINTRTQCRGGSFLPRTVRDWNHLPSETVEAATADAFVSRDFLQSPHSTANCLQHACSGGPGTIVCKSRATDRALITCNMPLGTKGQLSYYFIWALFCWLNHKTDQNEVDGHCWLCWQATSMLVSAIRGQAEDQGDTDMQKRLLAAAKQLADATAKLVEAAKVSWICVLVCVWGGVGWEGGVGGCVCVCVCMCVCGCAG